MVKFIPLFANVKKRLSLTSSKGRVVASIEYEDMQEIIRLMLRAVEIDEAWYLAEYPDVAEGIARGLVASARAHFIENGYFEGRLPFPLTVDDAWYRETYTDIAKAIDAGDFASPLAHFREFGYGEGRLPSAY